jgi:DNA-binding MarR family transcriptional regulator
MNRELELVETMDKLSIFIKKFQSQLLSGHLKNLTLRQLYYLELINNNEGITFSELAKILDVKKSTVSIAINQLTERGLVNKVQSTSDKRFYFLQLTQKGNQLIDVHMKVHKNAIKKIIKILDPDEVENFIKIVEKLTISKI